MRLFGNNSYGRAVGRDMTSPTPPSHNATSAPPRGARVAFELSRTVPLPVDQAWEMLTDWKGHEQWIPMTRVDIDPSNPDAFVAWSGPRPLALEDRMQVMASSFDGQTGSCRVAKLGPVLVGEASFTVAPGVSDGTTVVGWREDVNVRFVPRLLAPVVARIGSALFSHSLGRMGRYGSS